MASADSTTSDTSDEEPSSVRKRAHSPQFGQLKTDPLIFTVSIGFIFLFSAVTIVFGDTAKDVYGVASNWVTTNLGWLFIGGVSAAAVFLIVLCLSRFGRLRLGDDDERPDYPLLVWFAMLFAGGIGSVLMFWGIAEPLNHAVVSPYGYESMSDEAQDLAMAFTVYHLGMHMWVIFALPGLALGYFIYKRHLPPRVSSIFAPLLGRHIYRWPGKLIDAVAIIGTVFGIAVSVGMGTLQVNSGAHRVMGLPENSVVQLLLIAGVIIVASISVARGLDKGIKVLSNINIVLAVLLMLFVLTFGPTLTLLRQIVETTGTYLGELPELMFWTDSHNVNPDWSQGSWTVFYWAWTICWSPFIGIFVARISRGRTVREFIGGVLGLPTLFVVIWFSIFGRAGFDLEMSNPGILSEPVVEGGDPSPSLFILLEQYPIATAMSVLALVVILIFFITSIDSAAMVMDMMSTGAENKSPTVYRILWGVMIGAVAGTLLVLNGVTGILAIQNVVIIIGVPFFLLHLVMMYSLVKGMSDDHQAIPAPVTRHWGETDTAEKLERHEAAPAPGYDESGQPLPQIDYDYDSQGRLVLHNDVVVDGDFDVVSAESSDDSTQHS
ncbi:BCCT family transporter [Corynebacterium sp. TAE3-ERU12]|uniref:BCCT family transporter n=1 Tax=Corynebacterium sp. TAE3-ERU12 TaxID=2849491 RepID=UPI001C48DA67|nr:BCCT family transporter [Corynebacterium sp. TAE3-ERU12]MBV7295750.1 BCCT family transporter [Corynebacterium sp. TAE3-ERU12]